MIAVHNTDDRRTILLDNHNEWGEADWSILDDRRGNLPEFPIAALSSELRGYIERAAAGAGVTPGHVAVPLISIASGIIGTSRRVQPSRGWVEPLSIWAAVVGFSGTGKTPGIGVTIAAINAIERDRRSRIADLERKHQTKREAAKAAHKKWMREVDAAIDTGAPPPPMPAEATPVPPFVSPRLYVNNATIERIAALLQARPSGLMMIVDELAGLFSNMSRYSNGSDREFWLEAWNGRPYSVERVNSPAIALDHLLVGLLGGFQPDKLARAFDGDDDGFYARLCFAWPQEPSYRPLSNDIEEVAPELVNAFSRLIKLSESDDGSFIARTLPLSAEALETFEQFRAKLFEGKNALEGREREWWSKGATQVLRLAGTIALLEWAWSGESAELFEIGDPSLCAAVDIWEQYFWPHSRACLRQAGVTKTQAYARSLLRWIKREQRTEIGVVDARRDALGQSLDATQVEGLLDNLTKRGWLKKKTRDTGGRPLHRWEVNPALHDPFLSPNILAA